MRNMFERTIKIHEEELKREAREQGLEQGLVKVALNLLKEGAEFQFVSKVTGLSIKTLKKLTSDNN
ncbi:MAG: hypothetical protein JXR64_06550, partial [Spirochaetales bacterium]|nr:hypothetical protein [Spirochaetales bacterium]